MTLERQIVTLPFAQGLDTKTDEKQLEPGKLALLQNGVFTKRRQIRKKFGSTALPRSILGGGSISSADTLCGYRDEYLLGSAGHLYSWAAAEAAWVDKGSLPRWTATKATSARAAGGAVGASIAINSAGVMCITSSGSEKLGEGTYVTVTLVDLATNATVAQTSFLTGYISITKVAAVGDQFVVMYGTYYAGSVYQVAYRTVSSLGVVSGATVLVSTTIHAWPAFDCVSDAAGTHAFVVYPNAGGTDLNVASMDPHGGGLLLSSPTAVGMALGTQLRSVSAAVDETNGSALIASADSGAGGAGTVWLSVVNIALVVVQAKAAVTTTATLNGQVAVGRNAAAAVCVWWTDTAAYTIDYRTCSGYTPGGSVAHLVQGAYLASKPWVSGTTTYIIAAQHVGLTGGAFRLVLNADGVASAPQIHATVAGQDGLFGSDANGVNTGEPWFPEMGISGAPLLSGTRYLPVLVGAESKAENGTIQQIAGVDVYAFAADTKPFLSAEVSHRLVISTALAWLYDGRTLAELNFFQCPQITATGAGVGGTIPAGVYGYAALYEWQDATGAVYHSTVSVPVSVTTAGATSAVSGTFTPLTLTAKPFSSVRVVVYRTIANGSTYYRLFDGLNDPTATTWNDTGSITDLVLQGNEMLYTAGGVLDAVSPPAFTAMTVYRNRLVGVNAENPTQVWMSKQASIADPIDFSPLLTVNIDSVGGDCTGLAALDDKLLLFKRAVSYYLTGTGWDNTGGQNDFSVPILINANSGCVEPRSTVTAADGVMYKSEKGMFIMDRSLKDRYIGAEVEAWNAYAITGAQIVPGTNEVRFAFSGGFLVYDFLFGQWSVFVGSPVGSALLAGQHAMVDSTGVVSLEDSSLFTNSGSAYALTLSTGWLGPGDLQSFARIWRIWVLGDFKSAHTLNVQIAYDYDSTVIDTMTFTVSSGPYQFRLNPSRQKCEAIKVTIYDSGMSGTCESMAVSALSFLIGAKAGGVKLPAARQA